MSCNAPPSSSPALSMKPTHLHRTDHLELGWTRPSRQSWADAGTPTYENKSSLGCLALMPTSFSFGPKQTDRRYDQSRICSAPEESHATCRNAAHKSSHSRPNSPFKNLLFLQRTEGRHSAPTKPSCLNATEEE